ncbi:FAD:protein FMN transferase [Gorillibacterium sp. CAU 1737]|uniref:FAD:protein FMN transferase n=1 Tax=Gorillibacterium sp. CAU 1737 TaxID=3140362 RepID=UPI00326008DA
MNKASPVAQTATHLGMGTGMTHCVFGKNAEAALQAVKSEAARLESLLSCYRPESEISRINRSAGVQSERMSQDTYEVLAHAARFSTVCGGLFDVTIGPLVALWDYKNRSDLPEAARIREVLPLVHHQDLLLNSDAGTAELRRSGQSIDLGGIGKGYASAKILEVFKSFEVVSAYTNIGGNVAALGTKPDGTLWSVGIQHPRQENRLIGAVSIADKAVVTSGDYQRYFVDRSGKRRHHILDPRTGYPAESGLASVTVVADDATAADALSTILFLAGMSQGMELLQRFSGAEAILVDTDMTVFVTPGLRNHFQTEAGTRVYILNA